MASPTPDAPGAKPQDPVKPDPAPADEPKSEANGHAPAPSAEPSTESTSKDDAAAPTKALVNGNGATPEHAAVNGTKDTHDDKPDPAPKDEATGETEPATEEKMEDAQPEKSTDEAVSHPPEDVDMADASPTNEPAKSPKSPKAAEPAEPTKPEDGEPPKGDVAQDAVKPESPHDEKADVDTQMKDESEEPASGSKGDGDVVPSQDTSTQPASESDPNPVSISQLAIETTEPATSPPEASAEVSMTDAPTAKVSREREDDFGNEPAAKRAKTEPREEEASVSVITSTSAPTDLHHPSDLPNWQDEETNKRVISLHQRREIRKIIDRVKKTKSGGSFRDSVQKLWPGLWDSYNQKIDKPMDLGELNRTMKDPNGPYGSFGDFRKDLGLLFENALRFNGQGHDVTMAALATTKTIWEEIIVLPADEPTRPKSVPKPKPVRESRAPPPSEPAPRRQSSGPAPGPVGDAVIAKPAPPAQNQAADRRASTGDGDRPKRTVRAPKPKDIDYSTKSSRKKLKPELQFCEEVLTELMHPKNAHINGFFLDAVDAEGLNIPHYYSIVKKPMHLTKVQQMLSSGEISSLKDFDKNVKLIVSNCYLFNGTPDQGNPVSIFAQQLEDLYVSQMKGKDAWLAKHAKSNAPPASASNASDDDEDEEEDADGEDAGSGIDYAKEVRDMEAKLREETNKLNDLFAADTPNTNQIELQQSIVKVIQDTLLKSKQALAEQRQKSEKPGKKSGKASKTKASGGAAGRKSSGAASQPKKSGGSKKAAQKKNLTAADKDQIASAINDLDYPHLDRAIDIIKRDTNQTENTDGELELDIDQLSNEALLKLWELLKKVLPGFGKDAAGNPPSPEVSRAAPAKQSSSSSKSASKSKKNKPMSAREQEERISQLRGLQQLYSKGDKDEGEESAPVAQGPTPTAESSDESDSEEE